MNEALNWTEVEVDFIEEQLKLMHVTEKTAIAFLIL